MAVETLVGGSQGLETSLENARIRRRNDAEDVRRHEIEDFNLSTAKEGRARDTEQYNINKADYEERQQKEGFADFANALMQGVDPSIAMKNFNARGELQLNDVQFDRNSGRMAVVDSDGEQQEFENPNQFLASLGIQTAAEENIKLGKDDRLVGAQSGREVVGAQPTTGDEQDNLMKVGSALYNRETEEWITPPAAEGDGPDRYIKVDKSLYDTESGEWLSPPDGGDDGRDTSAFNPESTLQKITAGLVRHHGGTFDALGNYSVPGDREIVDLQDALAGESFARLTDQIRNQNLSHTEIANAVIKATKGLSTNSELEKSGEAWRVEGRNKTEEEKLNWINAERERQMAGSRAKLLKEEQKMLTRAGNEAADKAPVQRPEWAGNEIPQSVIGDARLQYGLEYDVELDGKRTTIRVAADGKVYEVGNAEQPSQRSQPPPVVETVDSPTPQTNELPVAREPESASEFADDTRLRGEGRGGPSGESIESAQLQTDIEDVQAAAGAGSTPVDGPVRPVGRGIPDLASIRNASNQDALKPIRRMTVAIAAGRTPSSRDLKILESLDDETLRRFGLNDEQIADLRSLPVIEQTLAQARRAEPEVVY